jgi:hypothetical protein
MMATETLAELGLLVVHLRYRRGWTFRLDVGYTSASSTCASRAILADSTTGTTALPAMFEAHESMMYVPVFLVVCLEVEDSTKSEQMIMVEHRFQVPVGVMAKPPWQRWLLDRCLDVDRHEGMELFRFEGGGYEHRPFYPEHGPSARLYSIEETDPRLGAEMPWRGVEAGQNGARQA